MLKLEKVFFYDDNDNIFVIHRRHRKFWSYLHWILSSMCCSEITLLWLPFFVLFCFFSGGKDSCYNMMQCVQHGHVIVALANLKPSDGGRDISSMWYGCTIAFFEKWVDLAKTTQLQLWKSMQKRLNVTFSSWFAILLFLVKLVQICTFHCRSHRIVIA